MKLRVIAEALIMAVFMIAVLVVILGRAMFTPADAEESLSAESYVQSGNRLYAAGRLKFSDAAIQYWKAIKLNLS